MEMFSLKDPSEMHQDNLNIVRCEDSTHFREKKKNLKDKLTSLLLTVRTRTSETV
jgi:hypothetical protein